MINTLDTLYKCPYKILRLTSIMPGEEGDMDNMGSVEPGASTLQWSGEDMSPPMVRPGSSCSGSLGAGLGGGSDWDSCDDSDPALLTDRDLADLPD